MASKLQGHLDMVMLTTTRLLSDKRKEVERRERERAENEEVLLHTSSSIISQYLRRYHMRMRFYHLWRRRVHYLSAEVVQRVYRGMRGRNRASAERERKRLFYSLSPYALRIQARVRAFLCISRNKRVFQAIRELYFVRSQEAVHSLAVRIQSHCRRYLGMERMKAVRELELRRQLNISHAILLLQRFCRMYLGKRLVWSIRRNHTNLIEARSHAGKKLHDFLAASFLRYKQKLSGEALKHFWRDKWVAAVTVQRCYRGFRGREKVRKVHVLLAALHHAASVIQRVFRGRGVLCWRDLRRNHIAAFVLDR